MIEIVPNSGLTYWYQPALKFHYFADSLVIMVSVDK